MDVVTYKTKATLNFTEELNCTRMLTEVYLFRVQFTILYEKHLR